MFGKKKTTNHNGLERSKRVRKASGKSCCIKPLMDGIDNNPIDNEKVTIESIILMIVGCRLAIQASSTTDKKRAIMMEVCEVFDAHCNEFLPDSSEFHDLKDERGLQYFDLFQSHLDEIRNDKWDDFYYDLGLRFEQFCLGGGGDGDALVMDSIFTFMVPLMSQAGHCWTESFVETFKYIKKHV